jgi:ABC-type anion transport system duplicated permease subunit
LGVLAILQGTLVRGAPRLLAVVLVISLAGVALSTRVALRSHADEVANLVSRVLSGFDYPANDFMPNDCRVL